MDTRGADKRMAELDDEVQRLKHELAKAKKEIRRRDSWADTIEQWQGWLTELGSLLGTKDFTRLVSLTREAQAALAQAQERADAFQKQRDEMPREFVRQRLSHWDDEPCSQCKGYGTYGYPDTSTWHRGGMAGQSFTTDVCDKCWGSGSAIHSWPSWRVAHAPAPEVVEQVRDHISTALKNLGENRTTEDTVSWLRESVEELRAALAKLKETQQ